MKKILFGLATAMVLSIPIQVMAATYNINETLTGTFLYGVQADGTGDMTHSLVAADPVHTLNTSFSFTNVNGSPFSTGGIFTESFGGGDATYGTFTFTSLTGGNGTSSFTGLFNVTGGTGLYSGAVGSGAMSGTDTWYTQVSGTSIHTSIGSFTTPVPEPETYGMLLVGLGLMGFTVRRRKNAQA
jgi:hypothetical protein